MGREGGGVGLVSGVHCRWWMKRGAWGSGTRWVGGYSGASLGERVDVRPGVYRGRRTTGGWKRSVNVYFELVLN